MPRLSIIIPAFNRAHCIGRALDSIRQQGLENFEIVLGDDASTDGTIEAVRRIFPDAKVAALAVNSGAAATRNAAMQLATGEFLAFLDSDVEWLPRKLGAQLEFLRENPDVALCATSHIFCRRDGFRRVLEDWDWMLRISQRHRIHVLPEHLAVIHENGPSNADFTRESMGQFLKKHLKEIPSPSPRRRVESQHWENTARCFFRHSGIERGSHARSNQWPILHCATQPWWRRCRWRCSMGGWERSFYGGCWRQGVGIRLCEKCAAGIADGDFVD